jgi:two-component system, response regulator
MKVLAFIFHYRYKVKNMNQNSVEVLLVEDNPTDAELTIRALQKHNMANNLFHVKNGADALDFIFGTGKYIDSRDVSFIPKVIFLDIQMPKMNGIEVLQKIKADPRTRLMPVVVLTSSRESPDIQECYDLGVNSYIVKPVNFEGFATAVQNLGVYWLLLNQSPT